MTGQQILREVFKIFSPFMPSDLAWCKAREIVFGFYRLTPLEFACLGDEPMDFGPLETLLRSAQNLKAPSSRMTGVRFFCGQYFALNESTLDPRWETEGLVSLIQARARNGQKILDLGTGSGCILISLLNQWPQSHGLGIDVSVRALEAAHQNGHHLGERVSWRQSDWFDRLNHNDIFDVIVANAPYVEESISLDKDVTDWDPPLALYGGTSGLACYEAFIPHVKNHLSTKGQVFLEIGWHQGPSVCALLKECGFDQVEIHKDWDQKERYVMALCTQEA